jgi:hypothetical protein
MLELDTLIDFAGHAWHARASQKWFAGQISQALEFHTNGATQVHAAEPAFASEYSGHGKQAIELIFQGCIDGGGRRRHGGDKIRLLCAS